MRQFSFYGPVDAAANFCVERRDLVERCVAERVGNPDRAATTSPSGRRGRSPGARL
jgi:hypothetical protein